MTQHLRDDGPVASSIHWKTRPGPRYRACFRLTRDDTVQVSVVDPSDHVVSVLASARSLKGGDTPHCFDWDGRDDAGAPVPRGSYRLSLTRVDDGLELISGEKLHVTELPPQP